MLINDDGFELGMPTAEEMTKHQLTLLTHEAEEAWHLLAKARRDIEKLVSINAEQADRIQSLQLDLNSTMIELAQTRAPKHSVSTWGMMPGDRVSTAGPPARDSKV